ncbi:hypothetical protein AB0I72_00635 [Nocardiopsis sp. NPDC049922]|uniref:hypothetical protein n=1 Tax=Nocardiopsis sp. NPDC049922 TaxID=3155157 RepID=UPI003402ED87
MAAKLNSLIPDGDLRPSREQAVAARLVVAGRAEDAEDLRDLLSILGLRDTKVCGTCHAEKPLVDFPRVPARWDGHDGRCAACKRAAVAARKAKPRTHAAAARKAEPGTYDVADLARMPEEELSAVLAAGGAPNP